MSKRITNYSRTLTLALIGAVVLCGVDGFFIHADEYAPHHNADAAAYMEQHEHIAHTYHTSSAHEESEATLTQNKNVYTHIDSSSAFTHVTFHNTALFAQYIVVAYDEPPPPHTPQYIRFQVIRV
jgi:hypothetical protein